MFEKPIICKTCIWEHKAWTENGLNDLRKCAKHQKYKMTETEEEE